MNKNIDNVGKCGHAKCAGGNGCFEVGKPMSKYTPVSEFLLTTPTNAEEARQYAMDWQQWQSDQSLSYSELAAWNETFTALADKYGLTEEFKENGII